MGSHTFPGMLFTGEISKHLNMYFVFRKLFEVSMFWSCFWETNNKPSKKIQTALEPHISGNMSWCSFKIWNLVVNALKLWEFLY